MKINELPLKNQEHERLVSCTDGNYHGLISIHNTRLGPAIGGTRFWQYRNEQEAINDVLRLARGMTYKNALAGVPFGGGKSIILKQDGPIDRDTIFHAHGRFVETFGGKYITAEDVGTSPDDMEFVRQETQHVAGLLSGSGNPSPVTARGVFRAMQAAAKYRWGSDSLEGRTVAIQGCGSVGYYLASYLNNAGAHLFVTDVDERKVETVVRDFGAMAWAPDDIYHADADVFAPCALGGVLNDDTINALKAEIVAGAANNQLLEPRHGDELAARNILYAPDYAANSGGVINGCRELLGWDAAQAAAKVDEIYDTVFNIFQIAAAEGIATSKAADRLAEERFKLE
ncbi:MAG TPA: amino acid dehydrogenase [Pyrinomonadaceae bacterium]|jgi:leucine dehydrogenase|nr:amino acid dehydrogenase [Pyrinomonadaceae bacterium]